MKACRRLFTQCSGAANACTLCRAAPGLFRPPVPRSWLHLSPEFHFNERGQISKHAVDCVQYSGMQLQLPLLARMAAQRRAMVPGLAGGSFDEC